VDAKRGSPLEDVVLEIHRVKDVGVRGDEFGLPEEEIAGLNECHTKASQDPPLSLGVEVHQRIPTDEEVHARDRGVPQHVLASEDDGVPQVGSENVPGTSRLEVPRP
jgi:hypothetical protein